MLFKFNKFNLVNYLFYIYQFKHNFVHFAASRIKERPSP